MTDDLEEGTGDPPQNFYPDVFAFVDEFLSEVFAHEVHDQLTTFRWCSQWYAHTEALARLEALWKAFEALRLDPGTSASVWFRDHADPCMNALTAAEGPFAQCSDTRHTAPPRLPLTTPPAGLRGENTTPLNPGGITNDGSDNDDRSPRDTLRGGSHR